MKALFHRLWSRPALRGVSAMAFMRYSTKGFSLIRLAFVAQFLSPADLGSFTLAVLFIAVAEVFTETGINTYLLKSPEKLKEYIHTAWGVSLIRGVLIATILLTLSPILSMFFNDAQLQTYFIVASLVPLIRGAINPAIIQYQQDLAFEKESILRIFLQFSDMILGLLFAFISKSALGLLWGVVAAASIEVILSFFLFQLKPQLQLFQFTLVGKLYRKTRVIIANGIMSYLTENLDYFVVGKVLGTTGLGLYQAGYKFASAVTIDLGSLIGQTLYPIYARLHRDGKPVAHLLQKSILTMCVFYLLLSLPLFIFIDPVIRLVFRNNDWLAIIPLIRVLFISGMLKSFMASWNPLSILAKNLHHSLSIHVITSLVLVFGILLLAPQYGVVGAGWAVLASLVVVQPYAWFVLRQAVSKLDSPHVNKI